MSQSIEALLRVMASLRDPDRGCPWDREQTMRSLTRYTVEEVFEVIDCIEREDYQALPEELGDLLFQIVFYARIGEEEGRFNFADITARIVEKLTRRHPHVFAAAPVLDSSAQQQRWESLKAEERALKSGDESLMADIPRTLPALMRAYKLQGRAARAGFDWPDLAPVFEKVHEELAEIGEAIDSGKPEAVEAEIGDLLFTCVNLARHLAVEPETALRRASERFEARFRHMEASAAAVDERLEALSPDRQDRLWRDAKQALDQSAPASD